MRVPVLCALGLLGSGVVVAACGGAKSPDVTPPPAAQAAAASSPVAPPSAIASAENVSLPDVGLDPTKLDRSADPCDDFYRFACGAWMDRTTIPPDKPSYGTFNEISDRNEAILHDILDKAAAQPGDDPVTQKIGAFYGACMDEAAVEKAGLSGLEPLFAASRKVKDDKSLVQAIATLHAAGVGALFIISPAQDKKDAKQMIAQINQGGLGLPDRDFYTADDERMKGLRAAYQAHLEKMFVLAGRKPAEAKKAAADSMAIETAIARSQKTRVELRDETGTYNKLDRAGLAKATPIAWDLYFQTLGFPDIQAINTVSLKYVETFDDIMRQYKPAQWRSYLDAQILTTFGGALPKKFVDENFALAKLITGQKELRPRWKRCISATDGNLGELLAQPYIKVAFGGDSKTAAEGMIDGITHAFADNLKGLGWMDAATKDKARDKLGKLVKIIGYPEKWRKYDFTIERGNYAANVVAGARFDTHYQLARIGKPVDKQEWQMTPPTVNAYYDPQLNEMVFPAGILQRPFYDVKSSVGVNLGAMGMIVGHELTHGFDDQGAQYDGDGNLSGWWPDNVTKAFGERTQCVAKYYSQFEPVPGSKINGELTLGENIADMGGVKLAFAAYRAARAGKKPQVADGFTEDQQFFLAVGQAWCDKRSDELQRLLVTIDPHSDPHYRVVGALSSLPEFADAFKCPVGAKMHPKDVCQVW